MLLRSSNFQFSIPRRQPHSRKDIDLLWVRCVRDKKLVQPHSRAIGVSAARGTTYKTTAGIESAPAATQVIGQSVERVYPLYGFSSIVSRTTEATVHPDVRLSTLCASGNDDRVNRLHSRHYEMRHPLIG